jgi:hypothetical protein
MNSARTYGGVAGHLSRIFFVLATGCGGQGAVAGAEAAPTAEAGSDASCEPGQSVSCACLGGGAGVRICDPPGGYGSCQCPHPDASRPAVCGDGVCDPGETCTACSNDCGECPRCDLAPSCSEGLALPSQPRAVAFADLSAPAPPDENDAGAPLASTCQDAQLRLRIARIDVGHQAQEPWLPTGTLSGPPQSYYCLLQASDGAIVSSGGADAGSNGTVEVALTRPTALIADFGGADFGPADSIFWGQKGPRLTQGNLTITYSCFQQKQPGSDSWANVLGAAAMAAGSLSNAGPYGWAFGLGSIALQVAAAAVASAQQQGDWHMFDVTHTIDKSRLLDLTNGRTWDFKQEGGDSAFHNPWSITVRVESWGCADPRPVGPR